MSSFPTLLFNGQTINLAKGLNLPPSDLDQNLWFRFDEQSNIYEFLSQELPNALSIKFTSNEFVRGIKNFSFCSRLFVQIVENDDYSSSHNDLFYLTNSMILNTNYILHHMMQQLDLLFYYHHEVQSTIQQSVWPPLCRNTFLLTTHVKIKKNNFFNTDDFLPMSTFFLDPKNRFLTDSTIKQIRQYFDQITTEIQNQ
jgi:hypothetical protein